MTREEAKSCIGTIEMLQRLAYNIHGVMDVIDADNCKKIIEALEQEPCEDAISRQAAEALFRNARKELMKQDKKEHIKDFNTRDLMLLNAEQFIHLLPSVTPQPKIGRWIEDAKTYYEELNKRGLGVDEYTPYFVDDIACSECLAKYSVIDNETQFFKHCPNCGARMEVKE